MVTAATTASSVSPPPLRISMPLPRAFTPLADEMITGRFAAVSLNSTSLDALGDSPFEGSELANSLSAPASALPASVVAKNFRRVQRSMRILLWFVGERAALHSMPDSCERKQSGEGEMSRTKPRFLLILPLPPR